MNDIAIVKNPNQHSNRIDSKKFVLGGRGDMPRPRVNAFASLRCSAVKVPRGGSPGSRMLERDEKPLREAAILCYD